MNKSIDNAAKVMLVHGAWADASCWRKVILLLEAQGHQVTAAQISLNSLRDDIDVVQRLLSDIEGPVVLVGHSYGGAVITGAAASASNVKALVYITAFGLDAGESLESLSKSGPPSAGAASVEADTHGYLWINRDTFHRSFAADVTADEAAVMTAVQRPLSIASFTQTEQSVAWKTIPSWYLVCTDDQMIPPAAQHAMASRMGAHVATVASSHAPFLSKPNDVFAIIGAAVRSVEDIAQLAPAAVGA